MSREDPLTGLANRREFDQHLHAAILYSQRHGTPLAVAMLDGGLRTGAPGVHAVRLNALAAGLSLTISAGASIWREGRSGRELLAEPDDNLYRAKRHGRNCVMHGDYRPRYCRTLVPRRYPEHCVPGNAS